MAREIIECVPNFSEGRRKDVVDSIASAIASVTGTKLLDVEMDANHNRAVITFIGDKKAVGDEFGKTIMGFRGDEPDYSISGLPWTPKFFDRFMQVKGYDVRPFLAAFLQPRNSKLTDAQARAKADYYDVFSQMFRDGFFKPQGDWCAANHLEYQVHLNHEEMEMDLTRSEGEFLRDMQYVQVPGIDAIWHQIWKDTISDYPRLAASALSCARRCESIRVASPPSRAKPATPQRAQ